MAHEPECLVPDFLFHILHESLTQTVLCLIKHEVLPDKKSESVAAVVEESAFIGAAAVNADRIDAAALCALKRPDAACGIQP